MNAPAGNLSLLILLSNVEQAKDALNAACAPGGPLPSEDILGELERRHLDTIAAFDAALIAKVGVSAHRIARALS